MHPFSDKLVLEPQWVACGGTIQLPADRPALDWLSSLLGSIEGFPFQEDLSEGSVLFIE
jgi:hypothetical protein